MRTPSQSLPAAAHSTLREARGQGGVARRAGRSLLPTETALRRSARSARSVARSARSSACSAEAPTSCRLCARALRHRLLPLPSPPSLPTPSIPSRLIPSHPIPSHSIPSQPSNSNPPPHSPSVLLSTLHAGTGAAAVVLAGLFVCAQQRLPGAPAVCRLLCPCVPRLPQHGMRRAPSDVSCVCLAVGVSCVCACAVVSVCMYVAPVRRTCAGVNANICACVLRFCAWPCLPVCVHTRTHARARACACMHASSCECALGCNVPVWSAVRLSMPAWRGALAL